jgi:hypothetical protein
MASAAVGSRLATTSPGYHGFVRVGRLSAAFEAEGFR